MQIENLSFCQINDKEIAMKNKMNVVGQVVFNFVDEEVYRDERTDS